MAQAGTGVGSRLKLHRRYVPCYRRDSYLVEGVQACVHLCAGSEFALWQE
jgi:hypothetical protein